MKITIETKKYTRRRQAKVEQEKQIIEAVIRNMKAEIEANPELLETVYSDEFIVGLEIQRRFNDLVAMSKEADQMAGGVIGKLAYKFSKR